MLRISKFVNPVNLRVTMQFTNPEIYQNLNLSPAPSSVQICFLLPLLLPGGNVMLFRCGGWRSRPAGTRRSSPPSPPRRTSGSGQYPGHQTKIYDKLNGTDLFKILNLFNLIRPSNYRLIHFIEIMKCHLMMDKVVSKIYNEIIMSENMRAGLGPET